MKYKDKKILIIGSGALSIGQAGEFDYSGSQAINATIEEGNSVVVINPNIATIQTEPQENVTVYLLPIETRFVEQVIKKEKPEAIIGSCGGQTAINCLVELHESGILAKYKVKILGTSVENIKLAEDRAKFRDRMNEIGVPTIPSIAVNSLDEAKKRMDEIAFPVIIRGAFALGGLGSSFAYNKSELLSVLEKSFTHFPQALLEKSLEGYKEVEYEILRDRKGNTISICNMENIDPLGVHTGDSIVVTPTQTLDDYQYQMLRNTSFKIVDALDVIGECNVQFALDPNSNQFYVIEVNPRLSRSSALASKATGYPIAYISTKVGLGFDLLELKNPVTKTSSAFFEPSLDYITMKIPRWDLSKFPGVSRNLGSAMKSVGEVMAIGRSFQEVLQKSLRMVFENSNITLNNKYRTQKTEDLLEEVSVATDGRILKVIELIRRNVSVKVLNQLTNISHWFLYEIEELILNENLICKMAKESETLAVFLDRLSIDYLKWKQLGFSDENLAWIYLTESNGPINELKSITRQFFKMRKKKSIFPVSKKIDTTSGIYPNHSNYFYTTYNGTQSEREDDFKNPSSVIILGSGSYRIGSSVEFDWAAVHCANEARSLGLKTIMINCNPETVSTDYQTSDVLYFEEISLERVLDIWEKENNCLGVITCMGAQVANNLSADLEDHGVKVLGHPVQSIDIAESRYKLSNLFKKLNIDQPKYAYAYSLQECEQFLEQTGFPILIRPGYILSGSFMRVAHNRSTFDSYFLKAGKVNQRNPVILTQYIEGAQEIEVDSVAKEGSTVCIAISEHLEKAGVHSGDSTLFFPTISLKASQKEKIEIITKTIAEELKLNGPFNIQYMVKKDSIKVIEVNVRTSRTLPFVSKSGGTNLAALATKVILKPDSTKEHYSLDEKLYGVKSPMFSFKRLDGVDPALGVEMVSTGEVGCIAHSSEMAFILSYLATGNQFFKKGVLLSSGKNKELLLQVKKQLLELDVPIYATPGTAKHLRENQIQSYETLWPGEGSPDAIDLIDNGVCDLVINIPKANENRELTSGFKIRQRAIQMNCSLITDMNVCLQVFRTYSYYKELSTNDGRDIINLQKYRFPLAEK